MLVKEQNLDQQSKFRTQFPRRNTSARARTRIESSYAFHSVFGTFEDK